MIIQQFVIFWLIVTFHQHNFSSDKRAIFGTNKLRRTPLGLYGFVRSQTPDHRVLPSKALLLCDMVVKGVKMEGGREIADIVRRLTEVGIPVMAHVGLLPQRHTSLSGYKVQGKTVDGVKKLMTDALALQDAGVFCSPYRSRPSGVVQVHYGAFKRSQPSVSGQDHIQVDRP
jgi:hypothetical protein